MIGDIAYNYDFPIYDLFDDDFLQKEAELAGSSSVGSWEESQGQQLRRRTEPSQPIYDTDGESYESISDECHEIKDQQSFLSEYEEESKEDILEQDENNEPSLQKEEAMEVTSAQEYTDLFTKIGPVEQNISELQEDTTARYDGSSSSDNEEDKGDSLSQESLALDPVEEGEILVEAYLPNIRQPSIIS